MNNINSTTTTFNFTSNNKDVIRPVTPEHILWYFRMVVFGILGQAMAVFGVITNTVNIIVFVKLGVAKGKDPMNVSLLGLSISDWISCFSVTFINLCMTPGFTDMEELPFTPIGTHYLFSSWPHLIFVKITCCITAFITIERCLCVTYPLKVKEILTTKRVTLITAAMYAFVILLTAPVYYTYRMKWVFFPERNRTLYTLVFSEDRHLIEPTLFTLFGVVLPLVLFLATILATVVLVHNLNKHAKWRKSVTTTTTSPEATTTTTTTSTSNNNKNKQQVTSRDTRVAKMVVIISGLFLACYSPVMISSFALVSVGELKEGGAYQNTLYVIFSINYLLESTNASFNILIYYVMSTNYKTVFKQIFFSSAGE